MGLEPTTFTLATCTPTEVNGCCDKPLRESPSPLSSAIAAQAVNSTLRAETNDPDLARVVAVWPSLPPELRAGILAIAQAAGGKG
jgi:hypothetical protein